MLRALVMGILGLLPIVLHAQVSAEFCGPLNKTPWDYRRDKQFYKLVEDAHFTVQVEALIRGQSGALPAPDIEYTLSVYPNHPRALMAATRLSERDQTQLRNRLPRPVECYYERALRFRPDDMVVRLLYAQFLEARNRHKEALVQVGEAVKLEDNYPLAVRHAGLMYIEMKEYELARGMAQRWALVSPDDRTLQEALKKVGQWRDAVDVASPAAASPAPSAAPPIGASGPASGPGASSTR